MILITPVLTSPVDGVMFVTVKWNSAFFVVPVVMLFQIIVVDRAVLFAPPDSVRRIHVRKIVVMIVAAYWTFQIHVMAILVVINAPALRKRVVSLTVSMETSTVTAMNHVSVRVVVDAVVTKIVTASIRL